MQPLFPWLSWPSATTPKLKQSSHKQQNYWLWLQLVTARNEAEVIQLQQLQDRSPRVAGSFHAGSLRGELFASVPRMTSSCIAGWVDKAAAKRITITASGLTRRSIEQVAGDTRA